MASKTQAKISFEQATGIKNIFANDWRKEFFRDDKKKVASIPFLRNPIEFTIGEADPDFLTLTSMIHWKEDTARLTVGELDSIYNRLCQPTGTSADQSVRIIELIEQAANSCLNAPAGLNFENKIVLSMAIRLRAERFAVERIEDSAAVNAIVSNQTSKLVRMYKSKFPSDTKVLSVLDRVVLVTPENIHLNSFMYEPIVDMSDEELKKLWGGVKALA
jgi:hypothetical protein